MTSIKITRSFHNPKVEGREACNHCADSCEYCGTLCLRDMNVQMSVLSAQTFAKK